MKIRQLLEHSIIHMTRSMNLRRKIVLLYCLIVLGPTALLAIGAGYLSLGQFRANYLLTIKEAVRQSAQSIEFKKQSYDLLATRTATDGELIARLSRDYTNIYEQLETVQYVDRSFTNMTKYLPGIEDFRIYHTNPTLVEDGGVLWKPGNRFLSGAPEKMWYKQTAESPKVLSWTNASDDKRKLIVTQKIISKYGEIYGSIFLLLNYNDVFLEPFTNPFSGEGSLYIVDNDEHIIASSEPEEIGERLVDSSLNPYWKRQIDESSPINGKLMITNRLDSGWTIVALVHLDRMEEQSKIIFLGVGFGIVFFLCISVFLLRTIIRNIVWRIRKLGARMTDISQGVFDVSVRSRNLDELGDLEMLFNRMSSQLSKLVEENIQITLKEREQSFKALQAQINPHFIYNSLSLIRWRAMDLNDETQIRIIDAMTTFFRFALKNRGENVTKIRDELEYLKVYLEIQQQRYPNQVTVEWKIDENLLDLYTIRMMLQPIVENSFLHGDITKSKDARILISISSSMEAVHFSVYDNGKGIPSDELLHIRSGNYGGTSNGYGVNGVRERLLLYFGSEADLEIDSVEGEWTMVTIRIPVYKEPPKIIRGETI